MVKHVDQIEKKAVEAELPLESFFVEDFENYAAVHINQTIKDSTITQKQIYDFQDKLLYEKNIERVLNVHPSGNPPDHPPTRTIFFIKFK